MRRSSLSNVGMDASDDSSRLDDLQEVAVVTREVCPGQVGRAKFRGSWWPIACEQDLYIPPGTQVAVVGRRNITLIVEPLSCTPMVSHMAS